MNAICLVIDRLHLGYIGPYGNHWVRTPTFDRLALESFVLDQFHLDSPQLAETYRSYWQGWHPLASGNPAGRPSLGQLLRNRGIASTLVTDDPAVATLPLAVGFDALLELDAPEATLPVDSLEQTHLAGCFARLIEELQEQPKPYFYWCHLGSLGATWDAPMEQRWEYVDDGDPAPPTSAEVPRVFLDEDYDPDELLGHTQAYAGQVSLLDSCLGGLLEFLESDPAGEETLLALLSPRGFPLGEHRRIGDWGDAVHSELAHLPLWIRFPQRGGPDAKTGFESMGNALYGPDWRFAAARSQALVQPGDVWATLLDWWSIADRPSSPWASSLLPLIREETPALRDRIVLADGGQPVGIRTPAWYFREGDPPELYAKPDDRWDVNDVHSRCGEIAEQLRRAMGDYIEHLVTGRLDALPPMEDVLLAGLA